MKRRLLVLMALGALLVAGCTGTSGHPTPIASTSRSGSGSASAQPPSTSPATSGSATSAAENPALDVCDDLGVLPCARQVNRVTLPIAGSSIGLVYSSDRQPGRTADPAPPAGYVGLGGWSLTDLPGYDPATKREVLPDGTVRTVTGVRNGASLAVADPTGSTVTTFDGQGRPTATADAVTGLPMATFTWTAQGLATVTDAAGGALTVHRDAAGAPTSLAVDGTSPMTLQVSDGDLAAVGYPDGGSVQLSTGSKGLLNGVTDTSGVTTDYAYAPDGRLTARTDPTGATTTYQRTVTASQVAVTTTEPGEAITTDTVTLGGGTTTFAHRDAGGTATTVARTGDTRILTSTGRTITIVTAGDPRWGADVLWPAKVTTGTATLVAGRTGASDNTSTTVTVDGHRWSYSYDAGARRTTVTDPTGASRTTTLDGRGRVVGTTVEGVPVSYTYDNAGRTAKITVGTGADARVWAYAYQPGRITVTNPVGAVSTETVDATGTVTALAAPGGTGFATTVDTSGRITGFAPPGQKPTTVTWGANGLPAAVDAPAGQGDPQFTGYTYDRSGRLSGVTTGGSSVTIDRNPVGLAASVTGGPTRLDMTYDGAGRLVTAAAPGTTLTQTYTGPDLTDSAAVVGTVKTDVTRVIDDLGRTTALTVTGAPAVDYGYDAAGNVTTAGAMTMVRDPRTGWITARKLGSLTESITYNQFGEPVGLTVTGPHGTVATITEKRDGLGRIITRTTVAGSTKNTTGYGYDSAGRLVSETDDGAVTTYAYDAAGNLTTLTPPTGSAVANTYDGRNELLRSGSATYAYDAAGRLASAAGPTGTTKYAYDPLGRLTAVTPPAGAATTYTVDALGRRVAAGGGGNPYTVAYLDGIRPAATYSSSGAVDETFVYDGDLQPQSLNSGGGALPAYLTKKGTDYLEIPDVSGGPGLVVNATDGTIADAVHRSALGQVRSETAPGFQIFGYAGGLSDAGSSLVHIGARDYDPATGRWTVPDPLGFAGGSANLYQFVSGDPVNRTDPLGTCDYTSVGISGGLGFGVVSSGSVGVAYAGGQFGVYGSLGGGVGWVGEASVGITGSCLNSDNGDTSLGNFGGQGTSGDFQYGPASGGSDKGYGDSGQQTSHGAHAGASAGGGLGGSVQQSITGIVCLFGCPPPSTTVCGDLGCSSSPGHSPNDPASNSGSGLPPASGARTTGDPHLRTADNTRYDMQAVGEFTWAQTDAGNVTVQVRQQPFRGSRTVAMTTAVAMQVDGDRMEFTPPAATSDPVGLAVAGMSPPAVGTFPLPHGATVLRSAAATVVTAKDGTALWVRNNSWGLDVVAAFPDGQKGKVHGLSGPFTGTSTGTVATASGRTLTTQQLSDYATLYRTFADSWRITQATSLFSDHPGTDASAFNDASFPDRTAPVVPAGVAAAAKTACQSAGVPAADLPACELDVAVTGDAGFAASTAAAAGVVPGAAASTSAGGSAAGQVTGDFRPGQTLTGTVAAHAAKDYLFSASGGTVGYFAADPSCAPGSPLTWTIENSTGGDVQGISAICGDIGRVVFPTTGAYRLRVESDKGGGSFRVTWLASRPDLTRPLTAGGTAAGTIDKPGAQDVWTLTVDAGTVAYLAADPSCSSATGNHATWDITDSTGRDITGPSYLCADIGRVVFSSAGSYRLVVSSSNGRTAPYALHWKPSRPDNLAPIQPGQSVSGTIDKPGAKDVWTATVTAGTVGYLAADPTCDKMNSSAATWDVTSPTGSDLTGPSFICGDLGRVVFPNAGTYHLVVAGHDGSTTAYRVRWEVSRPDAVKPLQRGQAAAGTIDKPGAQDEWTFTVAGGAVVDLTADPACDKVTASALTWTVVDGAGHAIVGSSYICSDLGPVTLPQAGTYGVMVSSQDGATRAYSFLWTR